MKIKEIKYGIKANSNDNNNNNAEKLVKNSIQKKTSYTYSSYTVRNIQGGPEK